MSTSSRNISRSLIVLVLLLVCAGVIALTGTDKARADAGPGSYANSKIWHQAPNPTPSFTRPVLKVTLPFAAKAAGFVPPDSGDITYTVRGSFKKGDTIRVPLDRLGCGQTSARYPVLQKPDGQEVVYEKAFVQTRTCLSSAGQYVNQPCGRHQTEFYVVRTRVTHGTMTWFGTMRLQLQDGSNLHADPRPVGTGQSHQVVEYYFAVNRGQKVNLRHPSQSTGFVTEIPMTRAAKSTTRLTKMCIGSGS